MRAVNKERVELEKTTIAIIDFFFFFFFKGPWCTHHGKFIFTHSQMIPYSSTYILNSHIQSLACSHSFCIILLHKYHFK